jgi:hypothetical protein
LARTAKKRKTRKGSEQSINIKITKTDARKILFSPFFLIGLFLLLLNDFYLKAEFHNFLTGKISDFAGLFVFPIFFSAFFPKRKLEIYISTGILFTFWKSSFSQSLIDSINSFEILRIGRTIDSTDLFALLILPVSFFYFDYLKDGKNTNVLRSPKRFAEIAIIIFSLFAFTATSYEEDRNILFDKEYEFTGSKEEMVSKLKNLDKIQKVEFRPESEVLGNIIPKEQIDPEKYHLEFKLTEKFCESNNLDVTIYVKEKDGKPSLEFGFIRYWCKEKPTEQSKEELLRIFEKDVAERLQLKPLIKKTENEPTNKTSSTRP